VEKLVLILYDFYLDSNLEILEAKDVKDGDDGLDWFARGLAADDFVESGHEPREQRRVQGLGDRVPRV
jgi:hypothetical protein